MFDLKRNAVKLAELLAALLIIWFMVEFGIGEPFHEDELLGMTQQQVRARYGEPDLTNKPPPERGDLEWVYYTGLVLRAISYVGFDDGEVVYVDASSPAK